MGLFGDKKKGAESLKTLSEKDIQSKLYGHLRNSDRIIQEDLPALSKPRQESQAYHKSSENLKTLTPSVSSAKASGSDLFAEAASIRRPEEEGIFKSIESKSSQTAKISFEKQQKSASQARGLGQSVQGIAGAFIQVLKQLIFKMVEAFATAVSAFVSLVFSIDFRKPSVRRFFYGAAAVAALVLIFTGIHHLNKNREIAMKAPHKKAAEQPKKSRTPNPSEALTAALSSGASEETSASDTPKSGDLSEKAASELKKRSAASERSISKTPEVKKAKTPAETVKTETKKEISSETSASVQTPGSVIQVATFATQEDASNLVEKFKAAGFSSFLKSVSRSGGRVYYCVFIGKFQTQQEAENKLAEFKKQEVARSFQDAFVRSL